MEKTIGIARENAGSLLMGLNLLLLLLVFFLYDPFQLIDRDYSGSRPLLEAKAADIKSLEIKDPDLPGVAITVSRGNALPVTGKKGLAPGKAAQSYNWKTVVNRAGSSETYTGDRERVETLLKEIARARRYYALDRTPAKDKQYDMSKAPDGGCKCMSIAVVDQAGKRNVLYLGKSVGAEIHVRLNDEDEIYLVRANLKSSAGSGDALFFRNRRLISEDVRRDMVATFKAVFPRGKDVILSKSGKDWALLSPIQGAARTRSADALVDGVLNWQARSFPTKLPDKVDRSKAFALEIEYRLNVSERKKLRFEGLGRKDSSTYFVRNAAGVLHEVSSFDLNDLFEPGKRLLKPKGGGPGGVRLPGGVQLRLKKPGQ